MIDSAGLGALLEARALTIRKNGRIGVVHVKQRHQELGRSESSREYV